MDINEKKERIINSFREAFDKDMAYRKVGVTEEERSILNKDSDFQERIEFIIIEQRESIVRKLRNLSLSENEQVALKATTELGKILYPTFFDSLKDPAVNVNVNVLTNEEEERINAEYGILLGGKDIFVKRNNRSQ